MIKFDQNDEETGIYCHIIEKIQEEAEQLADQEEWEDRDEEIENYIDQFVIELELVTMTEQQKSKTDKTHWMIAQIKGEDEGCVEVYETNESGDFFESSVYSEGAAHGQYEDVVKNVKANINNDTFVKEVQEYEND